MKIPKLGILRAAVTQLISTATWIPPFLKPILLAGASQIEYEKNQGSGFNQGGMR